MFASIISPSAVTVQFAHNGVSHTWLSDDPSFSRVLAILRNTVQPQASKASQLQSMMTTAEERAKAAIEAANAKAAAEREAREDDFNDDLPANMSLHNGVFYYNGEILDNDLSRRLVEAAVQGYDATNIINFMARIHKNPSFSVVTRLYEFLSKHNMPINADGSFLAYKIVGSNYKDLYTGKMDNSVGRTLSVDRSKVDDDMDKTCSHGLHCCSKAYLPHYGNGSRDRVVVVSVGPEDVVAIPRDYNDAKMRTCGYKVVGELPNAEAAEIFSSMTVSDSAAIRAAGVAMEEEYEASRFDVEPSNALDSDWAEYGDDAASEIEPLMYFIEDSITDEKIPASNAEKRAFNRGELSVPLFVWDTEVKMYLEVDEDEII